MQELLDKIGILFRGKEYSPNSALGTCVAFRQPTHFLTAAHCIGSLKAADLSIFGVVNAGKELPVKSVLIHPRADLAILEVSSIKPGYVQPFSGIAPQSGFGSSFCAAGFPIDTTSYSLPGWGES